MTISMVIPPQLVHVGRDAGADGWRAWPDLAQRARDLKGTIPAGMNTEDPETVRHVTLRCDGCEVTAELDWDDPRRPVGWTERDDGDFCPACSERLTP